MYMADGYVGFIDLMKLTARMKLKTSGILLVLVQ